MSGYEKFCWNIRVGFGLTKSLVLRILFGLTKRGNPVFAWSVPQSSSHEPLTFIIASYRWGRSHHVKAVFLDRHFLRSKGPVLIWAVWYFVKTLMSIVCPFSVLFSYSTSFISVLDKILNSVPLSLYHLPLLPPTGSFHSAQQPDFSSNEFDPLTVVEVWYL